MWGLLLCVCFVLFFCLLLKSKLSCSGSNFKATPNTPVEKRGIGGPGGKNVVVISFQVTRSDEAQHTVSRNAAKYERLLNLNN